MGICCFCVRNCAQTAYFVFGSSRIFVADYDLPERLLVNIRCFTEIKLTNVNISA